jgi:hypothetical protein
LKLAHVPAMEMDHPGIVALVCVALLIWVRSTVPYEHRTRLFGAFRGSDARPALAEAIADFPTALPTGRDTIERD